MRTHTFNVFTLVIAALLSLGLGQGALAQGKPIKVEVTAANPSDAFQGEELDVTVSGSGFDKGSIVSYLVTGTTDASQVEVLSVEVISSSELKTRIRPNDAALPSEYDIEVRTSSGRKGKGTTLFRVKAAETACTGDEPKEPTIVYTTEFESNGDLNSSDIYLSSASGCDQFLLVDDAHQYLSDTRQNEGVNRFIRSVDGLRLAVRGNFGVVAWKDGYQNPEVPMGIAFEWDPNGNIVVDPVGVVQLYSSREGLRLIRSDVRINDMGEIVLVMDEANETGSVRVTSVYNVSTAEYQVLSSGNCQVQDSEGDCYVPTSAIRWSPAGNEIYFTARNPLTGWDSWVIARIQEGPAGWGDPELVMEMVPGDAEVLLESVSGSGLMAYWRWVEVTNKQGRVLGSQRADAMVDLAECEVYPCRSDQGVALPSPGINTHWIWTNSEGLLFRESSGNTMILREYTDPYTGATGRLGITGVREFDSSL